MSLHQHIGQSAESRSPPHTAWIKPGTRLRRAYVRGPPGADISSPRTRLRSQSLRRILPGTYSVAHCRRQGNGSSPQERPRWREQRALDQLPQRVQLGELHLDPGVLGDERLAQRLDLQARNAVVAGRVDDGADRGPLGLREHPRLSAVICVPRYYPAVMA